MRDAKLAEIDANMESLRATLDCISRGLEEAKREAATKILELTRDLERVTRERDANAKLAMELQQQLNERK